MTLLSTGPILITGDKTMKKDQAEALKVLEESVKVLAADIKQIKAGGKLDHTAMFWLWQGTDSVFANLRDVEALEDRPF